jgi:hypothetical protein
MTSIAQNQNVTLVDVVDRLLGKGVSILGDAVISIAGVDLVYLSLRTLLASVDTLAIPEHHDVVREALPNSSAESESLLTAGAPTSELPPSQEASAGGSPPARRIEADRENVDRGLAQLVLTLIELIRQLMERQALRRVEAGSLSAQQLEDVGTALMKLAEKMEELKEHFRLDDDDLNLHLGPLGNLV